VRVRRAAGIAVREYLRLKGRPGRGMGAVEALETILETIEGLARTGKGNG